MIRGTLTNSKLLEAAADEWRMTGVEEVARVTVKELIGYRVTEIFNFNAGLYTQIARNIETNAESQAVQALHSLDEKALDAARAALASLGGQALESPKKKLPGPAVG